jgi:hypothetical protein
MSTSVDSTLNPFNFIHKHFLHICFRDGSYVSYAVIAVFNSLSVRGRSRNTADCAAPHRYKSGGVRSVYLLPYRKTHSARKTRSSIERTIAHFTGIALQPLFSNWIRWNNFNGNFDTDNQIYVP